MNQNQDQNQFTKNTELGIENMKKEFKTYDNTILVEGKRYRWSGNSDGIYTSFKWSNTHCKIIKIDTDKIHIYDYSDIKEYVFTNHLLEKSQITFKKTFLGLL